MAKELEWDELIAYCRALNAALSDTSLQKELNDVSKPVEDNQKRRPAKREVLQPIYSSIRRKFGLEGMKGEFLLNRSVDRLCHHVAIHELIMEEYYWIICHLDLFESFADFWELVRTPRPAPTPNAKCRPFTVKMVRDMQAEVIAGLSSAELQAKLREAIANAGGDAEKVNAAKKGLVLTVQSKVLPKYGFGYLLVYMVRHSCPIITEQRKLILSYWTQPELFGCASSESFLEAQNVPHAEQVADVSTQPRTGAVVAKTSSRESGSLPLFDWNALDEVCAIAEKNELQVKPFELPPAMVSESKRPIVSLSSAQSEVQASEARVARESEPDSAQDTNPRRNDMLHVDTTGILRGACLKCTHCDAWTFGTHSHVQWSAVKKHSDSTTSSGSGGQCERCTCFAADHTCLAGWLVDVKHCLHRFRKRCCQLLSSWQQTCQQKVRVHRQPADFTVNNAE